MDKEIDEILADDAFERYDYLHDDNYKAGVEENDQMDPTKQPGDDPMEDVLSTEFSELEDQVRYNRIKVRYLTTRKTSEQIETEITRLIRKFGKRQAYDPFGPKDEYGFPPRIRTQTELENVIDKLKQNKNEQKITNESLLKIMGEMRRAHELKKINFMDTYNFKDPIFKGEFPEDKFDSPNDPSLPLEVRKALSINFVEEQKEDRYVHDRESGAAVADYEELMRQYFRQKIHYQAHERMAQFTLTSDTI